MALKLDKEKAYDRLEWDFIIKCFEELGFHPKWLRWIRECISSVSYSLLVNGEPSGLIRPTRGIRQGDPLSPYIFIICMGLLSTHLLSEAAYQSQDWVFHYLLEIRKFPCFFFADDCLLFSKANLTACNRLKLLLETFCGLFGQMINYPKSAMNFSKNTSHAHKQIVSGIFNITRSESLGKYLGCPVFQGKPKALAFHDLVSRTRSKLNSWKANWLSKTGHLILIQSHLESLPAHTMQCFALPKNTSTMINNLARDFFWKQFATRNGLPLIARDKVCQPKSKGGLGLHRVHDTNLAFQSKLGWKVLTDNTSWWVQAMKAKYLHHASFLQYKSKPSDSPV